MPEVYGGALLGAGLNAGTNIAFGYLNNQMAAERERHARKENYLLNEKAAQNSDYRTRALYADLYSPQAQMQQIKEAGLSPSLFYGDTAGISGQSGAMGAGSTGISPTTYGANPIDAAIVAKTIAETEKIKEETKTERGANERGAQEIKKLISDTNNQELKNVYQEYENALAQCDLSVEASLVDKKVENYIKQTEKLAHETKSAEVKSEIDVASKNSVIQYLEEQTRNLAADTLLKQTQKLLTDVQIKLTKEQVNDLLSQITTREKQLRLNEKELNAVIKQWGVKNGFEKKLNEATIDKMTSDIRQGWTGKFIDLLNVIKR